MQMQAASQALRLLMDREDEAARVPVPDTPNSSTEAPGSPQGAVRSRQRHGGEAAGPGSGAETAFASTTARRRSRGAGVPALATCSSEPAGLESNRDEFLSHLLRGTGVVEWLDEEPPKVVRAAAPPRGVPQEDEEHQVPFFAMDASDSEEGDSDDHLELNDCYNFDHEQMVDLLNAGASYEDIVAEAEEGMARAFEHRVLVDANALDLVEDGDDRCLADLDGAISPLLVTPDDTPVGTPTNKESACETLDGKARRRTSLRPRQSLLMPGGASGRRKSLAMLTAEGGGGEEKLKQATRRQRLSIAKAAEVLDDSNVRDEDVLEKLRALTKAMAEASVRLRSHVEEAVQKQFEIARREELRPQATSKAARYGSEAFRAGCCTCAAREPGDVSPSRRGGPALSVVKDRIHQAVKAAYQRRYGGGFKPISLEYQSGRHVGDNWGQACPSCATMRGGPCGVDEYAAENGPAYGSAGTFGACCSGGGQWRGQCQDPAPWSSSEWLVDRHAGWGRQGPAQPTMSNPGRQWEASCQNHCQRGGARHCREVPVPSAWGQPQRPQQRFAAHRLGAA